MEKIRMVLWVTSKCNLDCKNCSQKYTRSENKDYEMSIDEVKHFIDSSIERGIHYYIIDYVGGEPSQWENLEEATKLIYDSGICDNIILTTNGSNPERIINILHMLSYYTVSTFQASEVDIFKHRYYSSKILWDTGRHKILPEIPFNNAIPAACVMKVCARGVVSNSMIYIKGRVYYCCLAFPLSKYTKMTEDLFCDFNDDFISKFSNKKFDKLICAYCPANSLIYPQLKDC